MTSCELLALETYLVRSSVCFMRYDMIFACLSPLLKLRPLHKPKPQSFPHWPCGGMEITPNLTSLKIYLARV